MAEKRVRVIRNDVCIAAGALAFGAVVRGGAIA